MAFLSEAEVEQALLDLLRSLGCTIASDDRILTQDAAVQTVLQQAEALSSVWSV